MIRVVCDSGAQIPPDLAERHLISVVPLTVTVDGVDRLEGVDLDPDEFWSFFHDGEAPQVSTAAPSPGQFATVYDRLVAAGASEIVSVHTGSNTSATFDAARLAAQRVDVPVHLVDTGAASFVVAMAALAAAESLADGADGAEAAARAERVAASCGNVFIVGSLDLARQGGRLAVEQPDDAAVPVLRLIEGRMTGIGDAHTVEQAAKVMAAEIVATGEPLRVGVGVADPTSVAVADALRAELDAAPNELEVLTYRVGASIGAHTGPGTAGAVYHPIGRERPGEATSV